MWKGKIDNIGSPRFGIFLVRFHSVEDRDMVLNGGFLFFNNRPVIMKPWDQEMNFQKNDIRRVPIWIQLENLELKYWGERTLFKLVEQLGEPIQTDMFTKEKRRLSYPRILIEVSIDQVFEEEIVFEDEYGYDVHVGVKYEWKPELCKNCKGIGHSTSSCKKTVPTKKEWIVKGKVEPKRVEYDVEGFQKVKGGVRIQQGEKAPVVKVTGDNQFEILSGNEEGSEQVVDRGEGGVPSHTNG